MSFSRQNFTRIFLSLFLAIAFGLVDDVLAYYPKMKLDFKNIKMKRSEKQKLKGQLLEFLADSPEVLKQEGKRYKVDQYCRYKMDLSPESNNIKLDTIEVMDEKENISYNLKIIEFLRSINEDLKIEKRNEDEPIEIGFNYLAF